VARDRAPLAEWAAQALAPHFLPARDLSRSVLPLRPANAPAGRAKKTDPTDADLSAEQAAASKATPAARRRVCCAGGLGSEWVQQRAATAGSLGHDPKGDATASSRRAGALENLD